MLENSMLIFNDKDNPWEFDAPEEDEFVETEETNEH